MSWLTHFLQSRAADWLWLSNSVTSDTNQCATNPCLNDGTCEDKLQSFVCVCAPGFGGETCETGENAHLIFNQWMFHPTNCWIKLERNTEQKCFCPDVDNCDPNPCKNSGVCTNAAGNTYSCACTSDWDGQDCNISAYLLPLCVVNFISLGQETAHWFPLITSLPLKKGVK